MNLTALLKYISNNYEDQLTQKFNKENTLNQIIANNIEKAIPIDLIGHNFEVKYSTGQGNWAFYPWITIFDKSITTTAQKGYYAVFLFTNDYKEVYLSLNQGWTYFKDNYKTTQGRINIKTVSDFWKNELRDVADEYQFSKDEISLNRITQRQSGLGKGYALGNIISKHYIISDLNENDNEKLLGDVMEMTNLLKDIKSKLVICSDPIDVTNSKIIEGSTLSDIVTEREQEKNKKNEEDKKLILSKKDYNKQNRSSNKSERVTKIDYEKTNRTKQYHGTQGELLVMKYEKQRLYNNEQLKEYADRVEHVSKTQGDGLGYDIVSYDLINNKVEKIFIEVKTVIGNVNSSVNISSKELKAAEKLGEKYKIYKVFNYKSSTPELIIIDDIHDERLSIEPNSYIIKVKADS